MEATLDEAGDVALHVVAEIVEADLVVRHVGDVAGVGGAACSVGERLVGVDDARGEAEEAVELAHPGCVATREVVIDGDEVGALAFERCEEERERRGKRLSLTGLHLGDGAFKEHHASDQLHIVVAHAERAASAFAADGEGLGEQALGRLALVAAAAELGNAAAELVVGKVGQRGLELIDALGHGPEALHAALVLGADDLGDD